MSGRANSINPTPVLGAPRKPLDNPVRPKPTSRADTDLANDFEALLPQLPSVLDPVAGERYPLLAALSRNEGPTSTTRQLLLVAAQIHDWADERRVAEYLLRHLDELRGGRRTSPMLISAARCAAEMSLRRAHSRDVLTANETLERRSAERSRPLLDEPSVGEAVVAFARRVLDEPPLPPIVWRRLDDAAVVAVELADEHTNRRNGLTSLEAMRSDARPRARLSTRLRNEFDDAVAGRSLARLLTGSPGSALDTALLWWVARAERDPASVPVPLRRRWARDLADADPIAQGSRQHRRRARRTAGAVAVA